MTVANIAASITVKLRVAAALVLLVLGSLLATVIFPQASSAGPDNPTDITPTRTRIAIIPTPVAPVPTRIVVIPTPRASVRTRAVVIPTPVVPVPTRAPTTSVRTPIAPTPTGVTPTATGTTATTTPVVTTAARTPTTRTSPIPTPIVTTIAATPTTIAIAPIPTATSAPPAATTTAPTPGTIPPTPTPTLPIFEGRAPSPPPPPPNAFEQCRADVDRAFVEADQPLIELGYSSPLIELDGETRHLCEVMSVYFPGADLGAAGRLREVAIDVYPQWVVQAALDGERDRRWATRNRGRRWDAAPENLLVYPDERTALELFDTRTLRQGCVRTVVTEALTPNSPQVLQCDEFPNATHVQGGSPATYGEPQPAIAYIFTDDNSEEGKKWKAFRDECDMQRQPSLTATIANSPRSALFLVIPVADIGLDTTWECRPPVPESAPEVDPPPEETPPGTPQPPEPPIEEPPELVSPLPAGTCVADYFEDRQTVDFGLIKATTNQRSRTGWFAVWNIEQTAAGGRLGYTTSGTERGTRVNALPTRVVSTFFRAARDSTPAIVSVSPAGDQRVVACSTTPGGLDSIIGNSPLPDLNCTHIGTAGAESIIGSEQNDIICSLGGADRVFGQGGDDIVFDDSGSNTIYGGPGDDSLIAGSDQDWVYGGPGDDILRGGSGNDTLHGDDGNDSFYNGPGDDYVVGGSGRDRSRATQIGQTLPSEPSTGDDVYYMGSGSDSVGELEVGSGDDFISLGTGADSGFGGDGNDFLSADPELFVVGITATIQDRLSGGSGNDVLYHVTPLEARSAFAGMPSLRGGAGNDLFVTLDGSWDAVYFSDPNPRAVVPFKYCEVGFGFNFEVEPEATFDPSDYDVEVGCGFGDFSASITVNGDDEITAVDISSSYGADLVGGLYSAYRAGRFGLESVGYDSCICDPKVRVGDLVVLDDPVSE